MDKATLMSKALVGRKNKKGAEKPSAGMSAAKKTSEEPGQRSAGAVFWKQMGKR